MKNKHFFISRLSVVVGAFLIFISITFAKEIDIPAGEDAISAAYAGASEGDILVLSTDGGNYIESVALVADKAVTIKAASGLSTMPVWITYDSTHISLYDDLRLKGIIFEGIESQSAVINRTEMSDPNVLAIEDCEFRYFVGDIITKESEPIGPFDSLIVKGSFFYDSHAGIDLEGFHSGVPKDQYVPGAMYFSIENCTFYNLNGTALKNEAFMPTNDSCFAYINHVTIYNCGGEGIYLKEVLLESMVINCIVTNCGTGVKIKYAPSNLPIYCSDIWNNQKNYDGSSGGGSSPGDGTIEEDPLFIDPTNGDFRLSEGSPCIGTASDGTDMGYLRKAVVGVYEYPDHSPNQLALKQNYPNPFNPETTIQYHVARACNMKLTVYNIGGEKIATLFEGLQTAGMHYAKWNGIDKDGRSVPSGIYIYRLEAGEYSRNAKMMLMK